MKLMQMRKESSLLLMEQNAVTGERPPTARQMLRQS